MNRIEVKNKLRKVIINMLSNTHTDEVPQEVINNVLQHYGCTVTYTSTQDDLDIFLKNLQNYIETTHEPSDNSAISANPKFDLTLYDKYLEAEAEYNEITQELAKLLQEVMKYKETYSEIFKNECKALDTSAEVLNKKCQFLKLQSLLKLYGEENSLQGHLALRNLLKEELILEKENYDKAVEANKRINEVKEIRKLSELYKIYKELKNTEVAAKMLAEL